VLLVAGVLGLLIGLVVGAIGGGGAILALPVLVYVLDSAENLMFVVAAHDARSSSAATGT